MLQINLPNPQRIAEYAVRTYLFQAGTGVTFKYEIDNIQVTLRIYIKDAVAKDIKELDPQQFEIYKEDGTLHIKIYDKYGKWYGHPFKLQSLRAKGGGSIGSKIQFNIG